jgi:hypothetical protein
MQPGLRTRRAGQGSPASIRPVGRNGKKPRRLLAGDDTCLWFAIPRPDCVATLRQGNREPPYQFRTIRLRRCLLVRAGRAQQH